MEETIRILLILIPALPLGAAALTAVLGPRLLKSQSHWLTIAALLGSFVCSLLLIREVEFEQRARAEAIEQGLQVDPTGGFSSVHRIWTWANIENGYRQAPMPPSESEHSVAGGGDHDFRIEVVLRADSLTAVMLVMVTLISLLVAIYAAGYMKGDPGFWRFFAYIGLFVFSMTMLVLVSNFVLLFVFWEAVGLCSYLLIGFWYQKPEAAAAGKKAFLVNRIGDFGFTLALFLIWTTYGTLNYHDSLRNGELDPVAIQAAMESELADPGSAERDEQVVRGVLGKWRMLANDYAGGMLGFAICGLLLLGACGKSAQFPLHVWLPDAMEGPTPVSALIHAATMVTAGVYMIVRCTPLFMASPDAQLLVSCIGAATALLAGTIALTQFDLKRVLAYSTISQLGFMFLALGTGTLAGITAGMFHLFTHAFFKALLFLGSGSVMHAMGNVIDMRRFGGLRRRMPITHWTFAVGCLALAGIVPLSGFWSKDAVVASVHDKAHALHASHEGHDTPGHDSPGHDARGDYAVGDDGLSRRQPGESRPWHVLVPAGAPFQYVSYRHPGPGEHDEEPAASGVFHLDDGQRATIYNVLYYIAMMTALMTAFYTFRAFFLTFYGAERIPHEAGDHAHESPASMTAPLVILALCAALVGLLFDRSFIDGTNLFANLLLPTPSLSGAAVAATQAPGEFHLSVAGVSTLLAFTGMGLAGFLYLGERNEVRWIQQFMDFGWLTRFSDVESVARLRQLPLVAAVERGARAVHLGWLASLVGHLILLIALVFSAPLWLGYYFSPYKLSYNKFYLDELYQVLFVWPLKALAKLSFWADRTLLDGLVNLIGRVPPLAGSLMRSLQMGLVPFYALAMVLGVLILIVARLWTGG